jgi:hypothetical protein
MEIVRAVPPANRRGAPRRASALIAAVASVLLVASIATAAAIAGSGGAPKLGTYVGQSSTNVAGNSPLQFSMGISRGNCSPPGGGKRHKAYCVTVSATSLIQSPCAGIEFVNDEFFPVTEPIALTRTRAISHLYSIYSNGSEESTHHLSGAKKVGTFQFALQVDTRGTASGSANFDDGTCASGEVKISAQLKR